MKNKTCTLCSFLIAAKGNWRNSVYIDCEINCPYKLQKQCSGFLMVPDSEGWPLLIPQNAILKMSGMVVDKSECLSVMNRRNFETLYSSWFDWQVNSPDICALLQAFNKTSGQSF